MSAQSSHISLQSGYELHWYRIESVLGQGAFGITYLAHDVNLDRQVAIKEYLPGQFSVRNSDLTIRPTTAEQKEDFEWGLKRFISEARTLTKFEHSNLVRVFNVFEMNNTAYMVMNYEVGKSLQQILKSRKSLNEAEVIKILFPLMSGLELMHAKGFVHRDIKPGNIFIREDGSPVLLDFGSARQTRAAATREGGEDPQTLTTLVSPGYAPIEQYGSKSDRQGPWTDIYGLGATLFRAVTGVMPVAAVDRGEAILHDMKDPCPKLSVAFKDRFSITFLAAIDHAMAFKAHDRPQSISDWRKDFEYGEKDTGTIAKPDIQGDTGEVITVKLDHPEETTQKLSTVKTVKTEKIDSEAITVSPASKEKPARSSGNQKILIAGAAAILLIVGAIVFMGGDEETPAPETTAPEQSSPPAASDETAATEATGQEEQPVTATPAPDDARQAKIEYLLELAKEDIQAMRLTSPKDNNAFDKYLAILNLDETNEAAKSGIQAISDKYVALAYAAMNSNKLDQADAYLKKASAISPGTQKVATAQEALQNKRTEPATPSETAASETTSAPEAAPPASSTAVEAETDSGFWNKVKKWHEEGVEESKKNPKKESELDSRVKDAFGN